MHWNMDTTTRHAARFFPAFLQKNPANQFGGRIMNVSNPVTGWNTWVIQPAQWPDQRPLMSSPENIISLFRENHYLEALAMVASWGTMQRQKEQIIGDLQNPGRLQHINDTLAACSASILATNSIEGSWNMLTNPVNGLGWNQVITSKVLHFLSRALGHEDNPPVPIDNKVILNRVWPVFRERFQRSLARHLWPENWQDNSFAAYNRYMTLILVLKDLHSGWTTTNVENTLFSLYGN